MSCTAAAVSAWRRCAAPAGIDLVMSRSLNDVRTESPLVYRNNGSGQFRAMPPEPFAGSDRYFGLYAVPADVNGDGITDFVVPQRHDGPDDQPRTADDFGTLVGARQICEMPLRRRLRLVAPRNLRSAR